MCVDESWCSGVRKAIFDKNRGASVAPLLNGLKRASAALIIIESISYMYNVIKGHRAKAKKKVVDGDEPLVCEHNK